MTDEYRTFWLIGGERVTDPEEAARRVLGGEVATEIGSETQARAAQRRREIEAQQAASMERALKESARRAFERSPAGIRQAILREGATSRVTLSGQSPDFEELDQYGRRATNRFKQ